MLTWLRIRWAQLRGNREYSEAMALRRFDWVAQPERLVNTSLSFRELNKARMEYGDLPSNDDLRELGIIE